MPSAPAIARSSGVVMKPRMRSALAPMYAVVTRIEAFSLFGYWRTLRERSACNPAIKISRLTTIATTGRRMKRSVSFIGASGLGRVRRGRHLGREVVPHHHRDVVSQLERPGADHDLAGFEPGEHGDKIAAPLAEADELVSRDQIDLLVRRLLSLDD